MFDTNIPLRDIPPDIRRTAANIAHGSDRHPGIYSRGTAGWKRTAAGLAAIGEMQNLRECPRAFLAQAVRTIPFPPRDYFIMIRRTWAFLCRIALIAAALPIHL